LSPKSWLYSLGTMIFVFVTFNCSIAKATKISILPLLRANFLSAAPPPYNAFWLNVATLLVLAILIGIGIAIRLRKRLQRKHFKIIGIVILVLVAVSAVFVIVWEAEPTISYWLAAADTYPPNADNSLTINCQNTGSLTGTFDLVIQFTRANFSSAQNSQPIHQIDNQTVRFTCTLAPGQQQATQVHFTVNDNTIDFYVFLSFQQNGSNFFVKSKSGGVTSVSFQKDSAGNFEMRQFLPPP